MLNLDNDLSKFPLTQAKCGCLYIGPVKIQHCGDDGSDDPSILPSIPKVIPPTSPVSDEDKQQFLVQLQTVLLKGHQACQLASAIRRLAGI